jgi:UDP-N-acetylmuramoyl-L-alanyl-D-glutamate--2,6-diaminopimelate ligase
LLRPLQLRGRPLTATGRTPVVTPPPDFVRGLSAIGVTGTNGKTTTSAYVAAAIAHLGTPVARSTTTGFYLDEERQDVPQTYDGFIETLRRGVARGGTQVVYEVTSEVLGRGFARHYPMTIGVFTNLTHDHQDVHGSAEHYLASKAQLFMSLPPGGTAVLNAADPSCALLAEVVPGGARIVRYAVPSRGDVRGDVEWLAERVRCSWEGTEIDVANAAALGLDSPVRVRAIGDIFAENALAALAAAASAGVPARVAAHALETAETPPGRFEVVARRPYVVVDYAHTPDALRRTVSAARALTSGRVTLVFGAGGKRDREKRPLMGAAAAGADRVILTSDNPRDEDPHAIAEAIRQGLSSHPAVEVELDRRAAMATAIAGGSGDDVVVIAGRGHETEQVVGSVRIPFSDRDVARELTTPR